MKRIVLAFLMCISLGAFSQVNFESGMFFTTIKWNSYQQFVDSYNKAVNADLKPFKVGGGFHFSLAYDLKIFSVNETYTKYWSSQTVEFKNGYSRKFNLSYSNWASEIAFGIIKENNFAVLAGVGLAFADVVLKTYQISPDKTISYHPGNNLSGIYRSFVSTRPQFSLKVQFPISESLCIYTKLCYQMKGDLAKNTLKDLNNARQLNDVAWELPTDYEEYLDLGTYWSHYYSAHPDDFVIPDISGVSLALGIKICINSTRID